MRRLLSAIAVATAAPLILPGAAGACAVCFGAADSAMTTGMNNGILALLGVVGLVQAGFVTLFATIWLRGRRLERLKSRFTLIRGGR